MEIELNRVPEEMCVKFIEYTCANQTTFEAVKKVKINYESTWQYAQMTCCCIIIVRQILNLKPSCDYH
jgi:hypothetical protein